MKTPENYNMVENLGGILAGTEEFLGGFSAGTEEFLEVSRPGRNIAKTNVFELLIKHFTRLSL